MRTVWVLACVLCVLLGTLRDLAAQQSLPEQQAPAKSSAATKAGAKSSEAQKKQPKKKASKQQADSTNQEPNATHHTPPDSQSASGLRAETTVAINLFLYRRTFLNIEPQPDLDVSGHASGDIKPGVTHHQFGGWGTIKRIERNGCRLANRKIR